ncbi:Beta-xylosidase [Dactylellina cionopaga]|nr:Beta-xylosidase [Dactylellina cionopaga]
MKVSKCWPVSQALFLMGAILQGARIARADNPIVQTMYTADPAPLIYNNRVYLFTGHDEDGSSTYTMKDWHLFSTADMANWQDHGTIMSLKTFSWANANAWAGQVIARNNKFYYYAPVRHSTGSMAIGVSISDNITGPYKDALGKPLVENNEIDPTVFIDDDGQAWLYWGNPDFWYVKLNSDMISYSGGPTKINLTTAGFGTRSGNAQRPTTFEEGPWAYKRSGKYYMIYAANCCSEDIRYSIGTSPTGPWTYKGIIMSAGGKSFTNHPGIIDYKDNSYFFYHNGALPGGSGYTRSVCVERFVYNSDGSIPSIAQTSAGPPQIGTLDPYVRQEAETIAFSSGLKTETCSEGGVDVAFIENGDYIKVKGVAFGSGAKSLSVRVASGTSGGNIEVHLGNTSGTLVGTCNVPGTGGSQTWTTVTCAISGATGTQDLFFRFTGGSGSLFNFNWWQFSSSGGNISTMTTTRTTTGSASVTTRSTTTASGSSCASLYGQCGGIQWSGQTCCAQGTCKYSNDYYSQCL